MIIVVADKTNDEDDDIIVDIIAVKILQQLHILQQLKISQQSQISLQQNQELNNMPGNSTLARFPRGKGPEFFMG